MGGKPNKGRKPRKHWHKGTNARTYNRLKWPKTNVKVPYDGEPQPLRRGQKDKRPKGLYH